MAKKMEMAITSTSGESTPLLVITPGKAPVVSGNFEDIENFLLKVRDRYENVELSTANIGDVQRIKTEMRTYRTSLEKIEKQIKDAYFASPRKVFEGNMSKLYALIAEVEHRTDKIIAEEDQKRLDGINQAIDFYANEAGFKDLREEFQAEFTRPKQWYNKTADEKMIKQEVQEKVQALLNQQKAQDSAIKIISARCAEDKRLSRPIFLRMLDQGYDLAVVLEDIDLEIVRLNAEVEGDVKPIPPPVPEEEECEECKVPQKEEIMKTIVLEFKYTEKLASYLGQCVDSAKAAGVQVRVVK